MWRCFYCNCLNEAHVGQCQYCLSPRREWRKVETTSTFHVSYDDDDEWGIPYSMDYSPYFSRSGVSTRGVTCYPDSWRGEWSEMTRDAAVSYMTSPEGSYYYTPPSEPKKITLFSFLRKRKQKGINDGWLQRAQVVDSGKRIWNKSL